MCTRAAARSIRREGEGGRRDVGSSEREDAEAPPPRFSQQGRVAEATLCVHVCERASVRGEEGGSNGLGLYTTYRSRPKGGGGDQSAKCAPLPVLVVVLVQGVRLPPGPPRLLSFASASFYLALSSAPSPLQKEKASGRFVWRSWALSDDAGAERGSMGGTEGRRTAVADGM